MILIIVIWCVEALLCTKMNISSDLRSKTFLCIKNALSSVSPPGPCMPSIQSTVLCYLVPCSCTHCSWPATSATESEPWHLLLWEAIETTPWMWARGPSSGPLNFLLIVKILSEHLLKFRLGSPKRQMCGDLTLLLPTIPLAPAQYLDIHA